MSFIFGKLRIHNNSHMAAADGRNAFVVVPPSTEQMKCDRLISLLIDLQEEREDKQTPRKSHVGLCYVLDRRSIFKWKCNGWKRGEVINKSIKRVEKLEKVCIGINDDWVWVVSEQLVCGWLLDVYVCVVVGEAVGASLTANGSCSSQSWRLMGGTNHNLRHTDRDLSFISFNL